MSVYISVGKYLFKFSNKDAKVMSMDAALLANNYLFKVNNKNRKRCEICS